MTAVGIPLDRRVGVSQPPRRSRYRPTRPILFVVPAFNEVENLPRLLADLEAHRRLLPAGSRVIIVDDGSDGRHRPTLVENYGGPLPVELVRLPENQGPGRRVPRRLRRGARRLEAVEPDRHARGRHDERPRRAPDDARAAPPAAPTSCSRRCTAAARWSTSASCAGSSAAGAGAFVRLALGLDARTVSSFFRVYRARPAARRSGALRRQADRGAGLRLQGRAAREAERARRTDRGGPRRARCVPARRQEQDARRPDHSPATGGCSPAAADRDAVGRVTRPAVAIVGGGILGLTAAYRLAQAGRARRGVRARAGPRRPRRRLRLRRATGSTASTTSSCRRTTASAGSPKSSASATGSASGRRASASTTTARLFSMSSREGVPDVPAPAAARPRAPRRVRRALPAHLVERGARRRARCCRG